MKKGLIVVLVVGVLLGSLLVQAEEQMGIEEEVRVYSGFGRFVDNVKMFFSGGDGKVRLALEIREKEVDSAIVNVRNQGEDEAIKNLERATKKLQVVQEKVSLNTSEEIKVSVEEIVEKIGEEDNLSEEFDDYLLEEEKTGLTAELTEKTFEYCSELAKEDFALMLKDEECNPDTAIPGLEKDLKNLKDLQLRMFVQLMLEIRSCIDDPGTCNCEVNIDVEQKARCEKMVALAVRCEYKDDEDACDELESMRPKKGDSFAESFVPDFLMNLFREKEYMVGYDTEPSDGVPEECWDYNDKPECRQYDYLKEMKDDWDEYGNFIGKRPENREPTMQESIPQCFDGDVFLEEKCGKISVVRNEEGLVNYIAEKDVDNIIDEFENKSEQHLMEIRSGWIMVDNEWVIDKGQMGGGNLIMDGEQVGNKVWEIKQEMNQISNQIKNITYAPGTGPGGVGGVVVDGDKQGVVTGGGGDGDDGLTPDVKTDVAGGGNNVVDGGDNVVDGGGQDVVTGGDNVVDGGDVDSGVDDGGDSGSNDVAGVDPGPDGIVGVVDGGDGDSGEDSSLITGEVIGSGNKEPSLVQEQYETYSGFSRFIDNVKMFFYRGDNEVRLALEIRGKEVNSAIVNARNGEDEEAEKNLERARERLQFVQTGVSEDTAEDVKINVDETISKMGVEERLSKIFEAYLLEEEKTRLTAELIIEVEGKEEQTRTREIETRMNEIDDAIADVVVDNVMDVDMDKVDPDAGPKTPIPTDGSICCKKTKYGETRHHWDSEGDCLDPGNIKGDVVNNNVCVGLGQEVLDEEDPESWGSIEGGVPEPCVAQGAYDDEACSRIMEMVEICCRRTVDGEVVYDWVPGKICVSPYGERVDEDAC